jgi:hypothetical protein
MLCGIGFAVFILRVGILLRCPFCDQGILERRWATGTSGCSTGIVKKNQSGQLLNNEAKRDKKTMYDEVKEKPRISVVWAGHFWGKRLCFLLLNLALGMISEHLMVGLRVSWKSEGKNQSHYMEKAWRWLKRSK